MSLTSDEQYKTMTDGALISEEIISFIATQSRILIASDFDGTLSEFTDDPEASTLNHSTQAALRTLQDIPDTYVAIISGRSLNTLQQKISGLKNLRLIGSHGHEFDTGSTEPLIEAQEQSLKGAECILQKVVQANPGTRLENKPGSIVFHYRGAPNFHNSTLIKVRESLSLLNIGYLHDSKMSLEFRLSSSNKGEAFQKLKRQICPTLAIFLGDDCTDESVFQIADANDITIKVGEGTSVAKYRLPSVQSVANFLGALAERRRKWMEDFSATPINHHLFLSDLRTAALVDQEGTVNWLCIPRMDGTPIFGCLVGGPGGGHFRIATKGIPTRKYLGNSLIGNTIADGITITDFFNCAGVRTYQRAGRSDLIRIVEGTGEIEVEFAPKLSFGRIQTTLVPIQDGLRIECGQQRLVLLSPGCEWSIHRIGAHDVAKFRRILKGEKLTFTLMTGTAHPQETSDAATDLLDQTVRFWEGWVSTLRIPQKYFDILSRSAVVLRGLTFGPTGAMYAAATTSLPETLGGSRNWDYRFCWPRDACLSASALLRLGASGPAYRLLDWLLGLTIDDGDNNFIAPLYSVTGRHAPTEAEVPEARGYRSSSPVRIGNLAAEQLQLDAVAPIVELMWNMVRFGETLTFEHLSLAEKLVSMVQSRWIEPDSGIWEVRGPKRHFVHSKVMCWYTLICAERVANYLGVERPEWLTIASLIRSDIENKGYDTNHQSYIAAYDLAEPDSALLWIILSEFHKKDHPRSLGTLRYIKERLYKNSCMYRYTYDDSLHGKEGEFIISRCWLIEALALTGNIELARELLTEILARLSPLGLMSEQWSPELGVALGNFPQAYSHLGLINAVCTLTECETLTSNKITT